MTDLPCGGRLRWAFLRSGASAVGMHRPTETKALAFEGIGFDAVDGTLEGVAAVYGNWDRANEVIEPGACAKSITERMRKIPMGLDHKRGFGVTEDLQEITRGDLPASIRSEYPDASGGLYCKGRVVLSDENIRRLDLIRQKSDSGQPVGMSITYRVLRESAAATPTGAKGRRLHELALHEWGPQLSMRPVNPAAMVTEAKSTGNGAGAKGWDMTLPGSDEERRARLTDALAGSMMLGGMAFEVAAVLPDALIVEVYNEAGGSRTYRAPYTETDGAVMFGPLAEVDIRPTVIEKAEGAAALEAIVADAAAAMKAGAVLSAANLRLVDDAITALTALRAAANKESAADTGSKGEDAPDPVAAAAPVAMPRPDHRLRLSLAAMTELAGRVALLPSGIY